MIDRDTEKVSYFNSTSQLFYLTSVDEKDRPITLFQDNPIYNPLASDMLFRWFDRPMYLHKYIFCDVSPGEVSSFSILGKCPRTDVTSLTLKSTDSTF